MWHLVHVVMVYHHSEAQDDLWKEVGMQSACYDWDVSTALCAFGAEIQIKWGSY